MIIGIGYTAGAGKDTVADHLTKYYNFQKISFADPLKRACREIFHMSDEQLYGNLKETIDPYWGVTPRFILQKVGTECMRNIYDQDIWIKSTGALVGKNKHTNYVIPDVRFRNEAWAIKAWRGKLIKIERPKAKAYGGIEGHPSETELIDYNDWDYTIHNDKTIKDLYKMVDELMRTIKP